MITDYSIFQIYFSDLHVPIAYIILTIGVFLLCYKKMPILRLGYFWLLTGFSVAFTFDGIYDFQYYLFVVDRFTFDKLIFGVYFIPLMLFLFFIKKHGKLRECLILLTPIIGEILLITTMKDYSDFIRYWFVVSFLIVITYIKNDNIFTIKKELRK